jgi:hypothetical protein
VRAWALPLFAIGAYVASPAVFMSDFNAPLTEIALGMMVAALAAWAALWLLVRRGPGERDGSRERGELIQRVARVGALLLIPGVLLNVLWAPGWPFFWFNGGHGALLLLIAIVSAVLWLRGAVRLGVSRSRAVLLWVGPVCITHQVVYWAIGVPLGYASWHTGIGTG